jgi:hypothetical protein
MPRTPARHKRFTVDLTPEKPHLAKGEVRDLRNDLEEAFERMAADRDFDSLGQYQMSRVMGSLKSMGKSIKDLGHQCRVMAAIVSGTAELRLSKEAFSVPIAGPNGAAATTFITSVALAITTDRGEIIDLIEGLAPTLGVLDTVVAAAAPTVVGTPTFRGGRCLVQLLWDTDDFTGGGSKEYIAAETVTLNCDLSIHGDAFPTATAVWTMV